MSLKQDLARARTEEDVKDAYIKALGLKAYNKGLVDIQTEEIWFEAKGAGTSPVMMFAQLLVYVRAARRAGERIPPFLAVIDSEKAAIMQTARALPIFEDKNIKWPKSGSKVDKALATLAAPYIETHFVVYTMENNEKEFVAAVKHAIRAGEIIRTPITPDNLRQVFDRWVEMIGRELDGVDPVDYALLFFADIMHDGSKAAMRDLPAKLYHNGDQPVFVLNGKEYELAGDRGYRNFWAIYHRPPEKEYRHYLLERRDSLLPLDERSFKGAYYTPLEIVDKAYDQLVDTLGNSWQNKYIVWDMCCGVGNLEVKHSNYRNIFMSTLDQADINVMKASQTCVGANIFQYDYLNDDVNDLGEIDYTISEKLPNELRTAIADAKAKKKGAKKILVLINPPYGESGSGIGKGDTNKIGVEKTRINLLMKDLEIGYSSKELFVQFLVRIQTEIPNSTIGIFSTLKYVNAPNFEPFRKYFRAKYLGGFLVHSKAFDGLKGDFPIGFLLWDLSKKLDINSINATVLDKNGNNIGNKIVYTAPADTLLNVWIERPKTTNALALPLSNALKVSNNPRLKMSCRAMIGYLYASNNDLQHAGQETLITSSIYTGGNGGGLYITSENLWQVAVVFTARLIVNHTWVNHNDQFLQPNRVLQENFKTDCLIWMLFHGKNLSAGADGLQWNGKKWSLINHFIPFTEKEVGSPGRFESDFMVKYLAGHKLTPESKAVLDQGRKLWTLYHATNFGRSIRDEFKLGRADAGWYQVRHALEANAENVIIDFTPFKTAFARLGDKLRPQVFELGFLRE